MTGGRLRLGELCALALACHTAVHAQASGTPPPAVPAGASPSLSAAPAPAAAGYVDRVLDDGPQPALTLDAAPGTSGWPRGWRVEYNAAQESGTQQSSSQGIAFSGFLDTPDYGALSLSAAINRARQGDGTGLRTDRQSTRLWRLDQLGLPLDGGWMANHSAGNLSSLQAPMARGFGRIGLPSQPLEGVTAQYYRGTQTQLNASLGRPGVYSGLGINGFDSGRGRLAFAGAQQDVGPTPGASTVALQLADAARIADASNPAANQNVRALWGGWRWQGQAPWAAAVSPGAQPIGQRDGGLEVQANAMTSRTTRDAAFGLPASEDALGAWADARWRSGALEQAAGVFYLEPNLRWGSYNAISDLRGVYWRGDIGTRQWQISSSTEWADSVSGSAPASAFASVTGRYRLDTRNTALGGFAIRRLNAPGESVQLGWETAWDLGQTQWRADALRGQDRRAQRLGIDHSFALNLDSTLALSLALERTRDAGRSARAVSWGVIGSTRPWHALSLDANLRGTRGGGARQINGNVGAAWSINPSWTLLGQFSSSRGQDPQTFALVSALTEAADRAAQPAYAARRFQLTLRYEERTGDATAPLGGAPGSGAGSVSGYVFFDTDNNGRRAASELGVPDVVIRLNGRFVTRTDAQGRYQFPAVAAGPHRLEIVADNVPLPWSPAARAPVPIEVLVRGVTTVDFALRREP